MRQVVTAATRTRRAAWSCARLPAVPALNCDGRPVARSPLVRFRVSPRLRRRDTGGGGVLFLAPRSRRGYARRVPPLRLAKRVSHREGTGRREIFDPRTRPTMAAFLEFYRCPSCQL